MHALGLVVLALVGFVGFKACTHQPEYHVETKQEYSERLKAEADTKARKAADEAREAQGNREQARIAICEEMVKRAARHPSTVSFSYFGAEYTEYKDNSAVVQSTWTGKNSFGLALTYNVECTFRDGQVSLNSWEAR